MTGARSSTANDFRKLRELRNEFYQKYLEGDFKANEARDIREVLAARAKTLDYKPLGDATLLSLHCLAAAALDQVGKYDEARFFLDRWASAVQSEVASWLRKNRLATPAPDAFPAQAGEKAWLLQEAGIAEYRVSRFETAETYLQDAAALYSKLMDAGIVAPGEATSPARMLSLCRYWLGCVNTYASRFPDAEGHFLEGLRLEAGASTGQLKHGRADAKGSRFGKYTTGRLLMGLGLLRFHMGALDQAESNLLAAKVLLNSDSRDRARQLRVELLLLSVKRTQLMGSKEKDKKKDFEDIIEALSRLAKELEHTHDRYFWRTQWTIGLAQVDLADYYRATSDPVGTPGEEEARTRALQAALEIANAQRARAHGSLSDQLQLDILKMRDLRRLGDFEGAIDVGRNIIHRPEHLGHVLLHTETLFALGHAYYDRGKANESVEDLSEAKNFIIQAGDVGRENPRAQAVCSLHLARIAHKLGLRSEAEEQFNRWEGWSKIVKLEWIERFARKVKAEISSHEMLVFSPSKLPDAGVYDSLELQLRQFLLDQVVDKASSIEAAANRLGVSRQTIYNWRKPAADPKREEKSEGR
jgi:tetratricopeptide (TPR) repeat protein